MKTKGGRHAMNPADAFRKAQRKKEIARNKAERQYIRSANSRKDKPQQLREELAELIELEQQGVLSKLQKIRKKVLQEAYDAALKKQKEEEFKKKHEEQQLQALADGTVIPEDIHPPARGGATAVGPAGGMPAVPLPKLPPLPAGPAPSGPAAPLPPPDGPPPGMAPLPPPPGPPPALGGRLPPPAYGPPGGAAAGRLAPPPGPPPVHIGSMPPPGGRLPPPGAPPPVAAAGGGAKAGATISSAPTTISGASTVTRRPVAHKDKALTSMVPASVRVRREEAPKPKPDALRAAPGFGLAPVQRPAAGAAAAGGSRPPGFGGGAGVRQPSQAGAGTGGMDAKLAEFMASLDDESLV